MRPASIRALAGLVALFAILAVFSAGAAAAPRAPKGFFGVHVRALEGGDFARMQRSDVGIVRTGFNFSTVRPLPAAPYDWRIFDNFVGGTANHGIDLLPVVYGVPSWLPSGVGSILDGPGQVAWREYLIALVDRYGPGGDFWSLHPEVEYRPIRYWQLWNEPNSFANWQNPDGREYGRFLTISADVIHGADPGASVVSGGIVSKPLSPDVQQGAPFLRDVLRSKAARRAIDIVAIHPYAKTPLIAKKAIEEARRTMNRANMKKTPIWITEIGWGSTTPDGSSARVEPSDPGPAGAQARWFLTPAKQRENLRRSFEIMLNKRRELGIQRVIWYQWQDGPDSACKWCETAGLLHQNGVRKAAAEGVQRTGADLGRARRGRSGDPGRPPPSSPASAGPRRSRARSSSPSAPRTSRLPRSSMPSPMPVRPPASGPPSQLSSRPRRASRAVKTSRTCSVGSATHFVSATLRASRIGSGSTP